MEQQVRSKIVDSNRTRQPGVLYLDGKPQEIIELSPSTFTFAPRGTAKLFIIRKSFAALLGLWFNMLWITLIVWALYPSLVWHTFTAFAIGETIFGAAWCIIRLLERRRGFSLG